MTNEPGTEQHLLVIDDNDMDIMFLEEVVAGTGTGCHIHGICDGEKARDYLRKVQHHHSPPALVLLDLNLPKVDGIALLKVLRANDALQDIPVLVWSSTRTVAERELLQRFRVNEFLVKPMDLEGWRKLGEVIQGWLQKKQQKKSLPA